MSDKKYSTIKLLDEESDDSDEDMVLHKKGNGLEFQDFASTDLESEPSRLETDGQIKLQDVTESDADDEDKGELLLGEKKSPPFWTFEYYQRFFDVDTNQVTSRIMHSMLPSKQNFLLTKIRPNPDLYGPFWICTTLIFTIAIFGNLSSYFDSRGKGVWKYDFHVVSVSACVIVIYASLVPTSVWGFLRWRGNMAGYTFLEIVCVYGYSLSIFVPISVLWVIEYDWLRWMLVILAVLISGSVLEVTLWPAVEDDSRKASLSFMVLVALCHLALAIGFKLYFFKNNQIQDQVLIPTISQESAFHSTAMTRNLTS